MSRYVGELPTDDPFYHFLAKEVLDRVLGFKHVEPVFDVYSLDGSDTVFRYSDRTTFVDLVGKFYGNKWIDGSQGGDHQRRIEYMNREYTNLRRLRNLGFDAPPHYVPRPLARSDDLNCVFVQEFVPGVNLDTYIRHAIHDGRENQLRNRVTDLAWFLADLHNRTQIVSDIDASTPLAYLDKLVRQLDKWQITSEDQCHDLAGARERWTRSHDLKLGIQVLIHGDPIPPHFIFTNEHTLAVIDVERLWTGDPAADVGCVSAELKHLFFLYGSDLWSSEPFIEHFYASYYYYRRRDADDFGALTERGRFYMGCYELRIARNAWLDLAYRRRLIDHALTCLAA